MGEDVIMKKVGKAKWQSKITLAHVDFFKVLIINMNSTIQRVIFRKILSIIKCQTLLLAVICYLEFHGNSLCCDENSKDMP